MKKVLGLVSYFILIISLTSYCSKNENAYVVTAKDGLTLRTGEGTFTKKKYLIPYGETVTILGNGKSEVIYNIKSNWYNIRTKNGLTGWVFGGFLEKTQKAYRDKLKLYQNKGPLFLINNFNKQFQITIKDNKDILGTISNYGDPISNEVYCTYDGGGGHCKLIKTNEDNGGLRFIIFNSKCLKYAFTNKGLSNCLNGKNNCYECIMNKTSLMDLIKERPIFHEISCKIIQDNNCPK